MRLILSRVIPSDFDQIIPLQFQAFDDVDLNNVFFGPTGHAGYAYAKRTILHAFHNDAADVWMKITDEDVDVDVDILDESGKPSGQKREEKKVVAGSNWKIWPTLNQEEHDKRNGGVSEGATNFDTTNPEVQVSKKAEEKEDFSHITWFDEPVHKRDAAIILADFLTRRRTKTAEAHLLCFLMFVDPTYQRKGAGKMVMGWGTELADQLMLPCWIEASPKGEGLYRQFGFEGYGKGNGEKEDGRVYLKTESFLSEYMHMRRPTKVERMEGVELKRI